MTDQHTPEQDLKQIIESAKRLGIELDESDALQWLTAITAAEDWGISAPVLE